MSGEERQHYIQLDSKNDEEGQLYETQLMNDHWVSSIQYATGEEEVIANEINPLLVVTILEEPLKLAESEGLFPTEVDESKIIDAKSRLSKFIYPYIFL